MDFEEISRRVLDLLEQWDIVKEEYDRPMATLLLEGLFMEHWPVSNQEVEQWTEVVEPIDEDDWFKSGTICCSG